jgi:hypothetical protein
MVMRASSQSRSPSSTARRDPPIGMAAQLPVTACRCVQRITVETPSSSSRAT